MSVEINGPEIVNGWSNEKEEEKESVNDDNDELKEKVSENEVTLSLKNLSALEDETNHNGSLEDLSPISNVNGVRQTFSSQEYRFLLNEYERVKDELLQLQVDYKSSLEREKTLCTRLESYNGEQDNKLGDLSNVNQELRSQLDSLLEEYNKQKEELKRLRELSFSVQGERDKLQQQLTTIECTDNSKLEELQNRVKDLESENAQKDAQIQASKEKQFSHDQAAKRAISGLQKELTTRIDQVTKMYEDCVREKEHLAMNNKKNEADIKKLQTDNENYEKKLQENAKELDRLRQKTKTVQGECVRLQTVYEEKEQELFASLKELEKLKEEMNSQAVKVKWAQNKLKTELEAHKDTKVKLIQTTQKLKEAREEGEQIRADCQAMIKQYQECEEMKSVSLDQMLKMKENELKKHEQEIADQDELHRLKTVELSDLKEQIRKHMESIAELKIKNEKLEDKLTEYTVKVSEHEKNNETLRQENYTLRMTIEELEKSKQALQAAEKEVSRLRIRDDELNAQISELETEIKQSHTKESEIMEFTEKMTSKNAQLQADVTALQAKVDALVIDKSKVESIKEHLEIESKSLQKLLDEDRQMRVEEVGKLSRELQEKTKSVQQLTTDLEDERNEIKVLKKKNAAMLKDLSRQLQQSRKRVECLEQETPSMGSRTPSNGSLDKMSNNSLSGPNTPTTITAPPIAEPMPLQQETVQFSGKSSQHPSQDGALDPEKTLLIERICRLQKIHAKKNEKLEFLEEHISSLIEEIQKKSRIIQYYALREEAGLLAPPRADVHKAQVAKHGGIMASLYSSKAVDPDMTLDLSLEINKKLQSVLEDTIIKNMTLKENIDTLGDEVARLSEELNRYRRSRR